MKFSSVANGQFVIFQRVAAPDYDTVMNINEIDLIGAAGFQMSQLTQDVWPAEGGLQIKNEQLGIRVAYVCIKLPCAVEQNVHSYKWMMSDIAAYHYERTEADDVKKGANPFVYEFSISSFRIFMPINGKTEPLIV